MSLRHEQYHALLNCRALLHDLLSVSEYPQTKREMRKRALSCLRHFPPLALSGKPLWSQDPFGPDAQPDVKSEHWDSL